MAGVLIVCSESLVPKLRTDPLNSHRLWCLRTNTVFLLPPSKTAHSSPRATSLSGDLQSLVGVRSANMTRVPGICVRRCSLLTQPLTPFDCDARVSFIFLVFLLLSIYAIFSLSNIVHTCSSFSFRVCIDVGPCVGIIMLHGPRSFWATAGNVYFIIFFIFIISFDFLIFRPGACQIPSFVWFS